MQKLPLSKQLSYMFARASGKDVLTSRLYKETKRNVPVMDEFDSSRLAYTMDKYYFRWLDAQPVPGETGQYKVTSHVYARNQTNMASGDRQYNAVTMDIKNAASPYFTRKQAEEFIRATEENWRLEKGMSVVTDAPIALSQFSIHRKANKRSATPAGPRATV